MSKTFGLLDTEGFFMTGTCRWRCRDNGSQAWVPCPTRAEGNVQLFWAIGHDMAMQAYHGLGEREGRDYTTHFHPCWRWANMQKLYEPKLPCFLANDLEGRDNCILPKATLKKGRHRVVQMQSGMRIVGNQDATKDEYLDGDGNLFRVYAIEDEPHLVAPMIPPALAGQSHNSSREAEAQGRGRRRTGGSGGSRKCSSYGQPGHNVRTCPQHRIPVGGGQDAEETDKDPTLVLDFQVVTPDAPPPWSQSQQVELNPDIQANLQVESQV